MKKYILLISTFFCLLCASCEYDNFDEPNVTITGKIVYNGNPVGVRTNGTQLELWQEGYPLFEKIPVYIAQDGTFSAKVFKGSYKITRLAGAPWEAQKTDTIQIEVKGNTVVEVPVKPYFVINKENIQKTANTITAKFTIEKLVQESNLAEVKLYLSRYTLLDQNQKDLDVSVDVSSIVFGKEVTISKELPANLAAEPYLFARIGVKSTMSNEFYYTQVQKIAKN